MALNSFFTSFLSQMIYVLLHKQTTITTRSTCIISTECIRIHLIPFFFTPLPFCHIFSAFTTGITHTLSLRYLHCSILVIIKISFNFLSFFSSQTTFCSTNQIPQSAVLVIMCIEVRKRIYIH